MNNHNARLFVVNDETFNEAITTGIASIKVPNLDGTKWLSTISSIMADMLQISIGDYLFFWKTKNVSSKSAIYGVYRAISKPYYECTSPSDDSPFKIHIEEVYNFRNPISEYEVLNCPYLKSSPWTIIGKKVAGKPRGTSPLSIDERNALITLLINRNPFYTYNPFDPSRVINVSEPLKISYFNIGDNLIPASLMSFNPNNLNYFKNNYDVYYEKILETIFNQEMSLRNSVFFTQLGIDVSKVIWYSNYLPYSIDGMEIDYLVIESDDNISETRIKLIEFMKDKIDKDHINRSLIYTKWLNEKMALGCNIVEPILICKKCENIASTTSEFYLDIDMYTNELEQQYKVKKLKVYTYDFNEGVQSFLQKR